ncbi:hypothetical protein [Sandaracinus amylolyticus]|uniref:hypothetical protein n=1 Tax=Sandaracinus amylolyticus TaxID=927083 RepID=UPI001F1EE338|nr:hypothetical protein [Sandaracinus amylolyticus]UJR84865.1 Hypothetical protein I5071_69440 [Sandaracinus amylolyticus]
MTRLSWSLLVLALVLPSAAHAQAPLAPSDVPAPLQPWIPWALDGMETYGCTFMPDGSPRCIWPGELALVVEPGGATFVLSVSLDHASAVTLPGDERRWPLDVRVDGRAVPVRRGGAPLVDLPAGSFRIEGRFTWSEQPETIAIPSEVGRIALRTPEGVVTRPRRDASTLWLQTATREAAQEDTLSIEVFRRIDDGSPMRITTRIALRVGGRPREIALGRALLEGVDPIAVTSSAPVRMSEDGELTVQVQAGSFDVEVVGVRASLDAPLRAIARAEIWPAEEIWVWSADEALRQVELAGADRIDPDRTNLPGEWRGLPTYLAPSGSAELTLTTTRRGNPAPPPNQVSLSRELWLDPDGEGLTGIDVLSGQMHQRWRLELAHGELGRATVDGSPHLISTLSDDGRAGVELRRPTIDVRAEWRDDGTSNVFSAVGWDEDVQSLVATLHLAPGFRLIAASGVDHAATWLDRWNLWGLFFVLVISLAIGRLAGPVAGATSLAVLVLSYHAPDAPFLVWIPLVITLALAKALPRGWMRESMRYAFHVCFALLCLLVVYFAGYELRRGIWPYADPGAPAYELREEEEVSSFDYPTSTVAPSAPAAEPMMADDAEGGGGRRSYRGGESDEIGGLFGSSGDVSRSPNLWSYEPNAVLQTGPGVPSWQSRGGQTITLSWDGPVTHDTEVRLWLVTPLENGVLAILEVALFGLFLYFLYRARPQPPPPSAEASAPAPIAAAAVLLAIVIAPPTIVRAQDAYEPSPQMIEQLRTRLTRAPRCAPNCADLAAATISIAGARLVIDLDVQASALSAVPLPGPLDAWSPATITIDGGATTAAARADDGYLYARVPSGAHRVRLEGALPSSDAFTLAFAAAPHHAQVSAAGWEVDGLSGGDRIGSSIQLRRSVGSEPGEGEGESGGGASIRVVPWLALERSFALGIRWEATTTVRRTSAIGAPIVARIPLLPGESVLSSDLTVENGVVVVTLGGTETERSWSSVLTPRESLVLTAPENERRSETWRVSCGTVWRCETRELDPVSIEQDGMWQPQFRPFPGDTLHVDVARLPAAQGQSMTIDGARLTLRPGERLTIATLSLDARSSVGSTQTITLPEGAVLQSVMVGGERRSVEQRDRQVSLTIAPGSTSVQLEWQEPRALDVVYRTSPVTLSGGAVNTTVVIERPSRWTLWLSGPAWGPVVLFWPYLLVLLVVSIALARVLAPRDGTRAGVSALDWALLGLGLSQLPWQIVWIVPSWVALIEWRRRTPNLSAGWSDLRQLVILGWTLITAIVLYAAIHVGLLVDPDTSIAPDVYSGLEWYVDRVDGPEASLPIATMISVPTWTYHVVMLLWSLWLAARLIAWSRWAFAAFVAGGMWRTWPPKKPAAPPPAPAPAAPAPAVPSPPIEPPPSGEG